MQLEDGAAGTSLPCLLEVLQFTIIQQIASSIVYNDGLL